MIRQSAFEKTGNKMLKGGLHCHTTRSDGRGDPADVIRLHAQNGYDFLALTDHRRYNYENFAPEEDIIIVPGMEMDRSMPEKRVHCFHTVCVGPSREDGNGFEHDQRFEGGIVSGQEEYQSIVDSLRAANNLVIYCHPEWSGTPACEFDRLEGCFAMEVWNSGCAMECDMDTDAHCWDDVLRQGKRIFGVATDDGHRMEQHCNGWVMVNAKRDLNSILAALQRGDFYSSCGPEIYDFRIEDDKIIVECSEAERIRFHSAYYPTRMVRAENGGVITRAEHPLQDYMPYIRASVVDKNGKIAWTNPIFLK